MLCINFDRGSEGHFKFKFMSDKPLKSKIQVFNEVNYKKHTD
jgi:hypothetical protein